MKARSLIVGAGILGIAAAIGMAATTQVQSYQPPKLVQEINTSLGEIDTALAARPASGAISNAAIAAGAAISVTKLGTGGLIPANSGASLTNIGNASIAVDAGIAESKLAALGTTTNITFANAGGTGTNWVFYITNGTIKATVRTP